MDLSRPLTIYHAFDMRYLDVMNMLPMIAEDGYTHVQLSPSQRSRTTVPKSSPKASDNEWWYRYQPLEFTIGNYYGTRDELVALTTAAHKLGLNVISDVCLNFVAELEGVSGHDWNTAERNNDKEALQRYNDMLDTSYPQFDRKDFKPRYQKIKETGRIIKCWYMGNLPGLNMESPKVQNIHFSYLQDLISAGIDGFRFDCAQWMHPDTMTKYFTACPTKWSYLEVIERRNTKRIQIYNKIGPISDYTLGDTLGNIFSSKNLSVHEELNKLDHRIDPNNVTFAVNHDTYHNEQSRLSITFADNGDRSTEVLATVLLLVMRRGVPLVFRETTKHPLVKLAVKFRKTMSANTSEATAFQTNRPNVVAISRGNTGLCIINNSRQQVNITSIHKLPNGEFTEFNTNNKVVITDNKLSHSVTIQPKSAVFFMKTHDNKNESIFSITDFPPLSATNIKNSTYKSSSWTKQ